MSRSCFSSSVGSTGNVVFSSGYVGRRFLCAPSKRSCYSESSVRVRWSPAPVCVSPSSWVFGCAGFYVHALRDRSVSGWSQRRFTDGRMIGLWREIIDCVEKNLHELATTPILLSSQLASESDSLSSPRHPLLPQDQRTRDESTSVDKQNGNNDAR